MINPAFPSAPPAEPPPLYPGLSPQNSPIPSCVDKKYNKLAEKTSNVISTAQSSSVFVVPQGAIILCLDSERIHNSSTTLNNKVRKATIPSPVHRPGAVKKRRFVRNCALCCCIIFGLVSALSIAAFFLSINSSHRPDNQIFYGMNGWHPQQ